MNELEILQSEIIALKTENCWLQEQLAEIYSSNLSCDLAGNLIADLAQNLVENLHTAIVVHATDTKILFANKSAAKILGLIQSEIAGKDVTDPDWHFYHGDGRLMGIEDFPVNKILREKQPLQNYEMGLYPSDTDDMVWVIINAYPEFDFQGEIRRIVVTFVDITQLKQTAIALGESEKRYIALNAELERTRNFLQSTIDHLPVAVFVKDGKPEKFGQMLLWNRTSEALFGLSAEKAIGTTVYDHFPKEQADFFYQKDLDAFANHVIENIPEEPIDSHSLGNRILHTVKVPLYDCEQRPQYLLCFSEDITERKQSEIALRESEEKFRQMAENIQEIFWMVKPDFSEFIYINPAYEAISGRTCASIYTDPKSFFDAIYIEDRKIAIATAKEHAHVGWSMEYRIVQPNGEIRWLFERAVPIYNDLNELQSIVGIGQDITERKFSEEQLIHQAFHDSLTGLPNRVLFLDRLEMVLKKSKRVTSHLFAILFIDLDQFKVINDSLGHLVGDLLLVEVAKILERSVRSLDTVARLGGDEFTILLDDIANLQEAINVSDRIHAQLRSEIAIGTHTILASASIGIVIGSPEYDQANDLLRDADIALYKAKEKGRACHAVFNRSMYDLVVSRLQLESELRQGIERREFLVYYEPIICLKTMQLKGFEALVRWQHPTRGLLAAGEFIPVAENTGLIVALGKWVLHNACAQLKLWQDQFPSLDLTINVNLSGKQLRDPNIVNTIDAVLQQSGLTTGCLNLEITETLLIENTEIAVRVFQELRARNIHLSLDDFGTGYSSLSYLQKFPVNTIKIDRSFISQIHAEECDRDIAIVKAIIALGHAMNIKIIAEGIELPEQIVQLQAWDCDFAQGYIFSRSLSVQDTTKLLDKAAQNAALF